MSWKHGASGYRNYKCRCEVCTCEHRERHKAEAEKRKARLLENPHLAPHGRPTTYSNWGCRCPECKAAWSEQTKAQYNKRKMKKQEAEWSATSTFSQVSEDGTKGHAA